MRLKEIKMLYKMLRVLGLIVVPCICLSPIPAQDKQPQQKIPAGAKVFVAPMDGFETYLRDAIVKKKVPLELVDQRDRADYEITGVSESKKASTAKKLIMGSYHSTEDASIKISNI